MEIYSIVTLNSFETSVFVKTKHMFHHVFLFYCPFVFRPSHEYVNTEFKISTDENVSFITATCPCSNLLEVLTMCRTMMSFVKVPLENRS